MILFPSYLVHWVYPNEADTERWSIAFNATFKKARVAKTAQTPSIEVKSDPVPERNL